MLLIIYSQFEPDVSYAGTISSHSSHDITILILQTKPKNTEQRALFSEKDGWYTTPTILHAARQ